MKTETTTDSHRTPPLWLVIAAFAAVYVIWGSTYLGIRYAVESIPPFLMAGTRNLIAGLLLFVFAWARGSAATSRIQWRDAAIAGTLMLAIGNGAVTWAEQMIPSGVTALLIALTPVWMVLFDWLRPKGTRPGALVIAGLVVGFAGVTLLARKNGHGAGPAYGWGVAALMGIPLVGTSYLLELGRQRQAPFSAERVTAAVIGGLVGWGINVAFSLGRDANDLRRNAVADRGRSEWRTEKVLRGAGDVAVIRRVALLDGSGLDYCLHRLRLAVACEHTGPRFYQRLCKSAYCRAARQHNRARAVLTRRICGGGHDYRCRGTRAARRCEIRSDKQGCRRLRGTGMNSA